MKTSTLFEEMPVGTRPQEPFHITPRTMAKAVSYILDCAEDGVTFDEEFEIVQQGCPVFFSVTCVPRIMSYEDGGWRLERMDVCWAQVEVFDDNGCQVETDFTVKEFETYF